MSAQFNLYVGVLVIFVIFGFLTAAYINEKNRHNKK